MAMLQSMRIKTTMTETSIGVFGRLAGKVECENKSSVHLFYTQEQRKICVAMSNIILMGFE